MHRISLVILLGFSLAGCALEAPIPSTGYLPDDAFSKTAIGQDPQMAAINAATNAFIHPGQMQGRPAQMALAIASLDAMAGQFSTRGRWLDMGRDAKLEMLDARDDVRKVLGVPVGADSQSVIDHLVAASQALDNGNEQAALAALSGPDFTKTPQQTLALLTNFPRVPTANYATMDASWYLYPHDDGVSF